MTLRRQKASFGPLLGTSSGSFNLMQRGAVLGANMRIYIGEAIGQITTTVDCLRRRRASGAGGCGFDQCLT